MADNKDFPSLNENTKQIFDEFAKIYQKDVIENGQAEVAKMCAQYNFQKWQAERVRPAKL